MLRLLGGWLNGIRPDDGVPGSLSEGAAERSEAEGVSSDGSTGPMVYPPAIINSVIFERLRSSGYTPSVSHSLDSSLREGAGGGLAPFIGVLAEIRGYGRFSSPLRNSEYFYRLRATKCLRNRKVCKKTARPGVGAGRWIGLGGNQKLDLMVEIRMSPATTRSSGAKLCWKLSE